MAANELSLALNQEKVTTGRRFLGLLATICAPTLLIQSFGTSFVGNSPSPVKQIFAFLGVLYIGGWICGAIGMFRQKVYGTDKSRKIVFGIQIILLTLALLFSVQETAGISYENGGGTFFGVCDAGYPLSHLFMFVVGVFTWRAKVWTGFSRFAPLLVGAALPLTLSLMPLFGMVVGFFTFGCLTTIGLGTIGYKIYSSRE
jgi:hypothetical protein